MGYANRGGKRERDNKNREVKCGDCGNVVSEMDTGIMCEVCDMWHHAKCKGIHPMRHMLCCKEMK